MSAKKKLGFLHSYLTLWIFLAMGLGVALGYFAPFSADFINSFSSGSHRTQLVLGPQFSQRLLVLYGIQRCLALNLRVNSCLLCGFIRVNFTVFNNIKSGPVLGGVLYNQ
ncbi:MAG: hypothetical protein WD426_20765 [Anditalea sp.]